MSPITSISCLLFLFGLVGCGINDRVVYSDTEGRLSEKLISNISKPGTKKSAILGNLGMPESVDIFSLDTKGNHFEVYNYRITEKQVRTGHLLYLFKMSAMEANEKYLHVVMRDDYVEKTWFDDKASGKVTVRDHQASHASDAANQKMNAEHSMVSPAHSPSNKKVYVVPEGAPTDSTVELQTKSGPVEIETKKTSKFEWKVPILKKWFGRKENKKQEEGGMAQQNQQASASGAAGKMQSGDGSQAKKSESQESQTSSTSNGAREMSEAPGITTSEVEEGE